MIQQLFQRVFCAPGVLFFRSRSRRKLNRSLGGIEQLECRVMLSAVSPKVLVGESPAEVRAVDLQPIVNGTPTSRFSGVGLVGDSYWGNFCSGTLINSTHVLTAAHCAEGVGNTQGRFTVNGTTYGTSNVYVHPNYNSYGIGTDQANDIAIYELSSPVTGVNPYSIYRDALQVGQLLTLVGFGAGGTGDSGHNGDFGTKRVGTTPIDGVNATLIT